LQTFSFLAEAKEDEKEYPSFRLLFQNRFSILLKYSGF
jgi:hypothetical protein